MPKYGRYLNMPNNIPKYGRYPNMLFNIPKYGMDIKHATVKPIIKNTSKEYSKCRILHFLIMECCKYLVF